MGEIEVDFGTFAYKNRTQPSSTHYISHEAKEWIDQQGFYCSSIHSIVTDDPVGERFNIEWWIDFDCTRNEVKHCVVHDMTGKFTHPITLATTQAPTLALTTQTIPPTPPKSCMERSFVECPTDTGCHWFGALVGCQRQDFCGFRTSTPCLARHEHCEWRGGKCRHKS